MKIFEVLLCISSVWIMENEEASGSYADTLKWICHKDHRQSQCNQCQPCPQCPVCPNQSPFTETCKSGFLEHDSDCYFFSEERKNWYDARKDCKSLGANLAVVTTKEKNEFIQAQMMVARQYEHYWIGGIDLEEDRKSWVWSETDDIIGPFTQWCPNQPISSTSRQRCLNINAGKYYCWSAVECTTRFYYVCEYPLP